MTALFVFRLLTHPESQLRVTQLDKKSAAKPYVHFQLSAEMSDVDDDADAHADADQLILYRT